MIKKKFQLVPNTGLAQFAKKSWSSACGCLMSLWMMRRVTMGPTMGPRGEVPIKVSSSPLHQGPGQGRQGDRAILPNGSSI